MNYRKRLTSTLNFESVDQGAVLETFYPWDLTLNRWLSEGLDRKFTKDYLYPNPKNKYNRYFYDGMSAPVKEFEQSLGLDPMIRMAFRIPYSCFDEQTIEDNHEYTERSDKDGWQRRYYKSRPLIQDVKPIVSCMADWLLLKEKVEAQIQEHCTEENLQKVYGKYAKAHENGEFSIRFRASGFFWTPRTLMGDEEHLIAFYEQPELLHEINSFTLKTYLRFLPQIAQLLQPDVILFEEDLSGKNGPMIGRHHFNEFVASYYERLIPELKQNGFEHVFVDTDGDFTSLIPDFIKCGVDGFLPMDYNSGVDIVDVRRQFPNIKLIGGFDKHAIDRGKESIDQEFRRLECVIRQGGYIVGCDHKVAPGASLDNYKYYIQKLKEAMANACQKS